jgi:hypothetical protein
LLHPTEIKEMTMEEIERFERRERAVAHARVEQGDAMRPALDEALMGMLDSESEGTDIEEAADDEEMIEMIDQDALARRQAAREARIAAGGEGADENDDDEDDDDEEEGDDEGDAADAEDPDVPKMSRHIRAKVCGFLCIRRGVSIFGIGSSVRRFCMSQSLH